MCGHMAGSAKLIFLCGKMAAGKSTLARELADRENAVLLVQDDFVTALFPGEITDIPSFVNRYTRLKNALTPHICVLLSKRISVVLDFAAATKAQRLSTNCILWTRQTPCAKRSFGIEAAGYLPEPAGPRRKTLKQSMRISSLHRRMKSSMSSVMIAFNALRKPLSGDSWRNIAIALIDNGVRFVSWVLSSCQFQWWNRTSTGDRVINVSPRSSSNASTPPFSQHSSGASVRALFSRQVMSYDLKRNLD